MKLEFLTSIATARGGFIAGRVIDVAKPTAEHLSWIEQGIVRVVKEDHVERAVSVSQAVPGNSPRRRAPRERRQAVP